MDLIGLRDLVADGEDRIERSHRLLEDHRDLIAPDFPHLPVRLLEQILAVIQDFASDDSPRIKDQPQDGQGQYAFS